MTNAIKKFVMKYSATISAIIIFFAPSISQECRLLWYQPMEPEGLDEFVASNRNE